MDRCLFRFPSPSCAGFRGSVVQDLPAAVGRVWAHHRTSRAIHSARRPRSEEHTSELQSLMRISYAVFCLKKKIKITIRHNMSLMYLVFSLRNDIGSDIMNHVSSSTTDISS